MTYTPSWGGPAIVYKPKSTLKDSAETMEGSMTEFLNRESSRHREWTERDGKFTMNFNNSGESVKFAPLYDDFEQDNSDKFLFYPVKYSELENLFGNDTYVSTMGLPVRVSKDDFQKYINALESDAETENIYGDISEAYTR